MKWERRYYDQIRRYSEYVCGAYSIRRTHDRNIFTGREMGSENQRWEIFKNGEMVTWEFTLREAKERVEKMEDEKA